MAFHRQSDELDDADPGEKDQAVTDQIVAGSAGQGKQKQQYGRKDAENYRRDTDQPDDAAGGIDRTADRDILANFVHHTGQPLISVTSAAVCAAREV